jgi:mono/diheme cytochrome c family protein
MPAQAHLTDEQIADVLSFVRNSFGNKASIVIPAEVKAIRAKTK